MSLTIDTNAIIVTGEKCLSPSFVEIKIKRIIAILFAIVFITLAKQAGLSELSR